jgi:radical SAM superfamily enzyme YgiQ (UPF0313 family)
MNIALLSPRGPLYRHRGGIFKRSLRYAPLTLTTLASLVPRDLDARVSLHDEGVQDIPLDLDADLVGISLITGTAPRAYELSAHYRRRGIPVVLGGPHVTLLPDEAQEHADAVVTGYAEETWPQLLRDAAAGRLRGRYTQDPDLTIENLPFPSRHLLNPRHYSTMNVFEATRSCVHACEFCVAPTAWGRRPYQKSVEHVVEDIRQQRAKKLIFVDLNLIADKAYATRLFEAMIPLRVRWFGLSTTLIASDRPLLDLMVRSGCRGLLLGFESISPSNLLESRKQFNIPEHYAEIVALLHGRGVSVMGCFVFGMDHDTPEVFERTARFVVDAHIDLPRFAILTPFPGTPLFERLEREGRILTRNWELYDGQHVVFEPRGMSVQALQEGHERAWRRAYRFRSIARRLGGARVQLPISVAANLGYRFYAHHLQDFYNCDWIVGQRQRAFAAAP